MKEDSSGDTMRAFGWGILLGGVAGLTAGFLLAPEEGRKLRRRASYQLESLSKQVTGLADHLLSPETDNEARRDGDAVVADARERAESIRKEIDVFLKDVQEKGSPSSQ